MKPALPQSSEDTVFVISHGKRVFSDGEGKTSPLFLGRYGWTSRALDALQFMSDGDAKIGIRDYQKATPLLFVDATPIVLKIERPLTAFAQLVTEYDPHEAANAG